MAAATRGVYWVGADGNVYTKASGQDGVANLGSSAALGTKSFDALNGLTEVDDPVVAAKQAAAAAANANATGAPANPNGGTGGAATTDKSNDIQLQTATAAGATGQIGSGIASVNASLANILGGYDVQDKNASDANKTASSTNDQNLEVNRQTALVNAAQGRQGLYATLASLGALSGSGLTLANQAVQKGANEDLSSAANNFGQNKTSIDSAYNTYTSAADQRRKDAEANAESARQNVTNTALGNQLAAYKALAGDYADMGDKPNAQKFTDLATSLIPQISASSVPAPLQADNSIAYTAPQLASYLAGNLGTQVTTTPGTAGGGPGLVATTVKKKTAAAAV